VLAEVSKLCVPGAKIVEICEKGDKILEEEVAKVYRGKKITKGMCFPAVELPTLPLDHLLTRSFSRFREPHHRLPQLVRHAVHPFEDR